MYNAFFFSIILILSSLLTAQVPTVSTSHGTGVSGYAITLAPQINEKTCLYSQDELESFLCALSPGFIEQEDIDNDSFTFVAFTRFKVNPSHQVNLAYRNEINKWFEDIVTVTTRGYVTAMDTDTITRFFKEVNQIIHEDKFIYTPGLPAANIIIEMEPPGGLRYFDSRIGETSNLKDNMGVRLIFSDSKIDVRPYNTGGGAIVGNLKKIFFTPEEHAFRRNNRFCKVVLINVLDPITRRTLIIHELLHTLGFSGHSPYPGSNLFPYPYRKLENGFKGPIIPSLAARMIEMLYRPEIAPGMNVKEARDLLANLKNANSTSKEEISLYVSQRRKLLTSAKDLLLSRAKQSYDLRMGLYIDLDKLSRELEQLLSEFRNILKTTGQNIELIQRISDTSSMLDRLQIIRAEIIALQFYKKSADENRSFASAKVSAKIKMIRTSIDKELDLLNKLIPLIKAIGVVESKLSSVENPAEIQTLENSVRCILRQEWYLNRINPQFGKN